MQIFKSVSKAVASGVASISSVTRSGSIAAERDTDLVQFEKQLKQIQNCLNVVREQFNDFTEAVTQSCESSVALSKTILTFYKGVSHTGTLETVRHFHQSQEDFAGDITRLITEERNGHTGLVTQMDSWNQVIDVALLKIKECEKARSSAQMTSERVRTLQARYDSLAKAAGAGDSGAYYGDVSPDSGGGAAEQQVEDSEEMKKVRDKINEFKEVHKHLVSDFNDLKTEVSHICTDIIECRFKQFDQMFVRLLEFQSMFFSNGVSYSEPFKSVIQYYRSKYPRPRSDHPSVDAAESASASGPASPKDGPISKVAESRPAPPTTKPPPPKTSVTETAVSVEASEATKASGQRPSQKADLLDFGDFVGTPTTSAPQSGSSTGTPHDPMDLFSTGFTSPPTTTTEEAPPTRPTHSVGGLSFGGLFSDPGSGMTTATTAATAVTASSMSGVTEVPVTSVKRGRSNSSEDFFNSMFGGPTGAAVSSPGTATSALSPAADAALASDADDLFGLSSSALPGRSVGSAPTAVTQSSSGSTKSTPTISGGSFLMGFTDETGGLTGMRSSDPISTESKSPKSASTTDDSKVTLDRPDASGVSAGSPIPVEISGKKVFAHDRFKEVTEMYAEEDKRLAQRETAMDNIQGRMDRWEFDKYGKRKNINNLFAELHTVLWDGCRWKKVGFTTDVKMIDKYYKKACMIIHPDKARQKGLDAEKTAVCERAFTAINEAYITYKETHGIK